MDETNELCCEQLRGLLEEILEECFDLGCVSLDVSMFHTQSGMTTVRVAERDLGNVVIYSTVGAGDRFDPDDVCTMFAVHYRAMVSAMIGG